MPEQMLARFNASSQSHVGPVEVWDDGPDGDLSASAEGALPLCVDLDGTLVKSNTVADSALALVRHNPRALLSFPGWLIQGMEVFRRRLEKSVSLDPASLPYNQPLLEFLFEQHAAGRLLYLSTAGNGVVAQRVADHFRVFAGVLVTDGGRGLRGNDKWKVFRDRLGEKFSYIGNAAADLPALTCCEEPMVANPAGRLRAGLRAARVVPVRSFLDSVSPMKGWLRAVRLHQWSKNALIFLPLLLAHPWVIGGSAAASIGLFAGAATAFLSFGLCASATYIVNDLLDLEADRKHPRKRRRPFAAGNLSVSSGMMAAGLLLAGSLALAVALPRIVAIAGGQLENPGRFLKWLAIYAISTTAYSLKLKRLPLVDVIVLSGLYTIRILTGSAATGVPISPWMGGFSIFFFLSLAYAKRFSELQNLRLRGATPVDGRGYLTSDIEQLRSLGTSSAFASVVVLTMYISSLDTRLYHHPGRLWLLLPVFLLWISQLWLLASRGVLNEDPVVYAITDKRSLLIGLLVLGAVLSAL